MTLPGRQVVRHLPLKQAIGGSNPSPAAFYDAIRDDILGQPVVTVKSLDEETMNKIMSNFMLLGEVAVQPVYVAPAIRVRVVDIQ
jgi:hypothetical protein